MDNHQHTLSSICGSSSSTRKNAACKQSYHVKHCNTRHIPQSLAVRVNVTSTSIYRALTQQNQENNKVIRRHNAATGGSNNNLFSRTTWAGRYQKDKPFWISLKQEMIGWQWHQLNHMQIICTSLQTDNHVSTSSLSFYGPNALPVTQPTA